MDKEKIKHLKSHLLYSQTKQSKYGLTLFELNDASNIYIGKWRKMADQSIEELSILSW